MNTSGFMINQLFFMHKNSRLLLIQDVRSFCLLIVDFCRTDAMSRLNMNSYDHVDFFIDWSINEILTKDFGIFVIGHRRYDEYKCLLDQIRPEALYTLKASMSLHDMKMIKGSQVRTLMVNNDLFISIGSNYKEYL